MTVPETIPRMHAIRDSDAAFGAAIARGVLTEDPSHERFAGWYMYMFHDTAGAAWFKHRETRQYVTMEPATCNGAAPGGKAAPGNGAAPGSKAASCDEDGPCKGLRR